MTHGLAFFDGETWAHLTSALLHTLWQGVLVAVLLYAVLKRTPARRADLRYGVAALSLAAIVVGGFLTWAILEYKPDQPAAGSPTVAAVASAQLPTAAPLAGSTSAAAPAAAAVRPPAAIPSAANAVTPHGFPQWKSLAAGLWLLGVVFMLGRAIIQVYGAGRLLKTCRPLDDPAVDALVERLRKTLRIARRVRVTVGEHIHVPAVLGAIWPIVLLPVSVLTGLPPDQLRAILAHELAHVRRHDYLVNLAQMLIEALLFFNPAVWWISRQIRIEREACCDALAVEAAGGITEYARALTDFAARVQPSLAGLQLAQSFAEPRTGGTLLERIRRIVTPGHRPRLRVPWYSFAGILLVSAAVLAALWAGTTLTVAVAGKILSPKERIDKLAELAKTEAPLPGTDTYADYSLETAGITVSGSVKTETTASLPNAVSVLVASVRRGSSALSSVRCEDGRFSKRVDYGKTYLQTRAEGYAPTFAGPFEAPPGGKIENIVLVLRPGFDGKVKVVDSAGAPIAGAGLSGRYDHPCGGFSDNEWQTDAAGIATISHCADVPLELNVGADGYQSDQVKVALRPGRESTLTLRPAKPTTGVVLSRETGRPIPDAEIRALHVAGPFSTSTDPDRAPTAATTDAEGRFVLNRLRDDSAYTFFVAAPGYRREFLRDIRAGQTGLKLALGPELLIRGRIVGPLDALEMRNGVRGVNYDNPYRVHNSSYSQSYWRPVEPSSGTATFELRDLFPGTVHITAGRKHVNLDVQEPDENVVIDLSDTPKPVAEAKAARTVILRLEVPPGAPEPKGELTVTRMFNERTGAVYQKSVRMPVEKGEVRLDVALPNRVGYRTDGLIGYWVKEEWGQEVTAGAEPFIIRIPAIPAGAIYGRVMEPNGSPAVSAFIAVVVVKPSPLMAQGSLGLSVKDSAGGADDVVGKFLAAPLPLGGAYAIVLHRKQTVAVSEPLELNEKTPMREIELRFADGVKVEGQVLKPDGRPAPGIRFRFNYGTPWSHGFGGVDLRTDLDGRFVFENVNPKVPGEYALELSENAGYRPARVKIKPDGKPLTIRLEQGRVLRGVVLDDPTALPIPGVEVYALAHDNSALEPTGFLNADAKTNDRGEFVFSTLAVREYSLHTRNANLAPQSQEILAAGGQNAPVTIRVTLPKGSELKPRTPAPPQKSPARAEKGPTSGSGGAPPGQN